MKQEITMKVLQSVLDSLFQMGYGTGLKHAETDLDKWYIGWLGGNITIPLLVHCEADTIFVEIIDNEISEMGPCTLLGYVVGIIKGCNPDIYLGKMDEENYKDMEFYYEPDRYKKEE